MYIYIYTYTYIRTPHATLQYLQQQMHIFSFRVGHLTKQEKQHPPLPGGCSKDEQASRGAKMGLAAAGAGSRRR